MEWIDALADVRAEGRPAVLVTLAEVRGHAPRQAGAKMLVTRDGTWDSIGGGNLEEAAAVRARGMLASGASTPQLEEIALNEHARAEHGLQCCGGVVKVLLEPIAPPRPIALFGLGHVGSEAARIFSRMPVALHLVDTREEYAAAARREHVSGGQADVTVHHPTAPESVLRELPDDTYVLILTHDHAEDLFLCEAALERMDRGELNHVGVIGSSAKWARFRKRLREAGHDDELISEIRCPIGLSEVPGKSPTSIAVSMAAEYLSRVGSADAEKGE
ncbi:MAG: xanthine dehydrogenase accessory protein XdhC [Nesterenkonia sp.]|nr:xanthine dehydrogenase accessory protein XdhC [Nesterenkonia sp.]